MTTYEYYVHYTFDPTPEKKRGVGYLAIGFPEPVTSSDQVGVMCDLIQGKFGYTNVIVSNFILLRTVEE
jgi:hypothetical protein